MKRGLAQLSILHLLILALVQGITEFLPISSSAHLILIPELTGWPDQGLLIDVAVHVGTLGAVLIYFRRDTTGLFLGALALSGSRAAGRRLSGTDYPRLLRLLILATLPIVIAGALFAGLGLGEMLRRADVIAAASIVFGLVLYWADQRAPADRGIRDLDWCGALIIGLAQILALVPGTSRAGITMTAARWLGLERTAAARFSMLLAIPTILAAGGLAAYGLATSEIEGQIWQALAAALLSFVAAMGAIHFLMRWLAHASMTIFVAYRVVLGAVLLILVYG